MSHREQTSRPAPCLAPDLERLLTDPGFMIEIHDAARARLAAIAEAIRANWREIDALCIEKSRLTDLQNAILARLDGAADGAPIRVLSAVDRVKTSAARERAVLERRSRFLLVPVGADCG